MRQEQQQQKRKHNHGHVKKVNGFLMIKVRLSLSFFVCCGAKLMSKKWNLIIRKIRSNFAFVSSSSLLSCKSISYSILLACYSSLHSLCFFFISLVNHLFSNLMLCQPCIELSFLFCSILSLWWVLINVKRMAQTPLWFLAMLMKTLLAMRWLVLAMSSFGSSSSAWQLASWLW